jgi:MFS family permease
LTSPSSWRAWYGVVLLLAVYINSFLDRTILTLLIGPIRKTTGLSDSEVGFLIGPAFAIFYTAAGLPLGWLADRVSRVSLIVVGQGFWSLATVAFGLARSFSELALARIGVGVGEASLSPAAYSIVTDLFPPDRLARALSVYSMGIHLGGGLASFLGGLLLDWTGEATSIRLPLVGERHFWQVIFFAIAVPTLPLTLLLLTTFREPARREDAARKPAVPVASGDFFRYFRENAGAFVCHNFGFGFLSLAGYAALAWIPELFVRVHGWERAFVGKAVGLNSMIVGVSGLLFGGFIGDFLARRGYADSKIRVGLLAVLVWLPFGLALPFAPDGRVAFALWVPMTFAFAMPWGAAAAAVQEMVPNQMRGQATGLFLFVINLVGLGLGPLILPLVTEYVLRDERRIHVALAAVALCAEAAAFLLLVLALPRFRQVIAYRERWMEARAA